jgi:hypothetical protein
VTATKDATIRQRHPVTPGFNLEVNESHVQIACRIGAEWRAALELIVDCKDIFGVQGRKHFHSSNDPVKDQSARSMPPTIDVLVTSSWRMYYAKERVSFLTTSGKQVNIRILR